MTPEDLGKKIFEEAQDQMKTIGMRPDGKFVSHHTPCKGVQITATWVPGEIPEGLRIIRDHLERLGQIKIVDGGCDSDFRP